MFKLRQMYLVNAVAVLLLLTTVGQSAVLNDNLQTTAAPALLSSSLTTQLNNYSMEEPKVLRLHRPCRSEHVKWCENDGQCMYPQDRDEPSCICTPSYSGPRCMFFSGHTRTGPVLELEQLIAIGFGVAMFIIVLAVIIYCFAYKRCIKSAPLIKSEPSEVSV